MKRPVVVGASGQVGQQIASALERHHPILTSRRPEFPKWRKFDLASAALRPAECDLLLDGDEISAVYCVGGATDVERCESEPDLAYLVNEAGPAKLAEAAEARNLPFVYFSTEYVFSGNGGPYAESDTPQPLSVYGKSKWRGELAVIAHHTTPLIVRTTVVYGFDRNAKNFLYGLRRRLSQGETMKVAEDQISTPTYNKDLAAATVELVSRRASGIYHVCGPERISRHQFAQRAASLMKLDDGLVLPAPTSELNQLAPRPLNAGLSTRKLQFEFPHVSMRTMEKGIADFIAGPFALQV